MGSREWTLATEAGGSGAEPARRSIAPGKVTRRGAYRSPARRASDDGRGVATGGLDDGRDEAGPPPTIHDVATVAVERKGGGAPVDAGVATQVGAHLGADLSGVRVHTDPMAQGASAAMGARAFAYGNDVFLGAGESGGDLGLMAHELTHVVQQGAAGRLTPQRRVEVGDANSPAEAEADAVASAVTAGPAAPTALIVDDGPVAPGQMLKSTFMEVLRTAVSAAAADELGPLGSVVGCPYIDQYFARYRGLPASQGEALLKRFAPATRSARTAEDMMAPVVARVRDGVRQWKDTGQPPADLVAAEPEAAAAAVAAAPTATPSGPGAAPKLAEPGSPADQVSRLGTGQALDGATAARMEDAFGESFGAVRIHTDPRAARLADEQDAHAVTIGQHVAFASGAFRPGTVEGDALIAHELAHVSQQAGAGQAEHAVQRKVTDDSAAEASADGAARGVLSMLYGGASRAMRSVRDGLTTDVGLKRCSKSGGGGAAAARPTPVAVRNGPTHAPIDSGDRVGMAIAITITSSTGVDADMAGIEDSEQVGLSYNHTGSCATLPPLPSNQSGFMPGHPIPDDQHGWSRAAVLDRADNHGGTGSFEKQQLDIWKDPTGGVTTPVAIPSSGYIIKRIITKLAGTKVMFRTEKRPAAVTVNGYSTTAGPSATQGDDVEARA